MEHWTADSRRRPAGAYRQARHADNGRTADHRRRHYLDVVVGPAVRTLHRSEEHTSELQSQSNLVCRLLLEKKKTHTRTVCRRSTSVSIDLPAVVITNVIHTHRQ